MFIGAAVDHIGVAIDYIFTRKTWSNKAVIVK
jgi:hypothetical protein